MLSVLTAKLESVKILHSDKSKFITESSGVVAVAICTLLLCNRKRQEFQITAENIVLRDLKDNGDQLQFSMFVLINNDAAVLSVDNVLQAIEV